ncbi:Uncharacterized membrane protein YccC [Pseudoxanthobacter soli DSM 19599]|uniref:Uncharacterized membrane protein YccC n=1 Tax=Pseudoxanthobacter soli DSM 19599 TaxID=1123029 RepID=A0A1M7Z6K3_9HYPH|nr:FUSC family protein [Pseudoxanthobacter soli]SHO60578.1 Uncharacterized membrane protein YccC [Pseudoxanthobacter soli DSM 19599]
MIFSRLGTALSTLRDRNLLSLVPQPMRVHVAPALRAGIATIVPILVSEIRGQPEIAAIGVAGFLGCLVDPGGSWRRRFLTMGGFAVLAALVCWLGYFASLSPYAAIPVAFLGAFVLSYAMVFGAATTSLGLMLTIELMIFLGTPMPGPGEVMLASLCALIGGLWAMLVTLVVWNTPPDTPARGATAIVWQKLADLTDDLAGRYGAGANAADWESLPSDRWAPVRAAIEDARTALAAVRRTRSGPTERSLVLLVLLSDAEECFKLACALSGTLEQLGAAEPGAPRSAVLDGLAALTEDMRAIAEALERMRTNGSVAALGAERREEALRRLRQATAAIGRGSGVAVADGSPHAVQAALLFRELGQSLEDAGGARPAGRGTNDLAEAIWRQNAQFHFGEIGETLRTNFTVRAVAFRHSVRVAVGATAAYVLSSLMLLNHGYWLSITTVLILQPHIASTWRRMLDRIAGTVAGSVVAAVLLATISTPMDIALLVFPFLAVAVLLRGLGYAFYVFAMTVGFLLIADLFIPSGMAPWTLALVRVENSFLGAALALIVAFAIWPNWEERGLPRAIANSLRAASTFLSAALASRTVDAERHVDLATLQRECGLANNNSEAKLQRLVSEPRLKPSPAIAPAMAMVIALRRLTGLAIELDNLPEAAFAGEERQAVIADARRWIEQSLGTIAGALEGDSAYRPPEPLPAHVKDAALSDAEGAGRKPEDLLLTIFERIERQIAAIGDNAADFLAVTESATRGSLRAAAD